MNTNTKSTRNFHKHLRGLLTVSGVTRAELARHLGVTPAVVNRWLSGASAPDLYQFREIARFFEVPYECFLDCGDPFPDTAELAERLGLSKDTVERLMELADTECPDVLDALDDVVYTVLDAMRTAREV